jgi:hypothetical protein
MQESFPVLTFLSLFADTETKFVITNAFLGGSASPLQRIHLTNIQFPTLLSFLSSASDLVELHLSDISITNSGHISPEAMATCLPTLTRLRSLSISIGFEPRVLTSRDPPPSSSTIILPALTNIELDGPYGCLEDLVARIEAPLLNSGDLRSCDEPTYVTPRLFNFIHRTEMFKFPDLISVYLRHKGAFFDLRSSVDSTEFSLSFPFHESHTPVELFQSDLSLSVWAFSLV